jgi:hypothetical protein
MMWRVQGRRGMMMRRLDPDIVGGSKRRRDLQVLHSPRRRMSKWYTLQRPPNAVCLSVHSVQAQGSTSRLFHANLLYSRSLPAHHSYMSLCNTPFCIPNMDSRVRYSCSEVRSELRRLYNPWGHSELDGHLSRRYYAAITTLQVRYRV